jgi:hypothetical protein
MTRRGHDRLTGRRRDQVVTVYNNSNNPQAGKSRFAMQVILLFVLASNTTWPSDWLMKERGRCCANAEN